ncbi:CynX/NimT family MFS transporter [Streptomyces aidingensis]|uniref:MFS transporter, CP family, cyanate transporter n=1 Tax=Streptomyces aidingensis TaxID=910347 RepID=A0A1I1LZ50_9ACTN|nr:MFS transporter [Streptomyces aidingensis]SFC78126.1 MFS transporter, CP family, cyanate transporter [Streptomyces aidingensis]
MALTSNGASLPETPRGPRRPAEPAAARRPAPRGGTRAALLPLVATGLVLAALNLRPAISGLGPLLAEIRDGLHLSGAVAGLLTSAPALCFAVFGSTAPRLARRHGPAAVVLAGMAAIAAGTGLRALAGSTGVFLATTALALAGIAVTNVLMPVLVARYFPDRIGAMTGLYSMALALGTAGAAAVTVPLTGALGGGWRTGLGMWTVPALAAVLLWTAVLLRDRTAAGGGRRPVPAAAAPDRTGPAVPPMSRSATAWLLAVFFGFQSTGAYIAMGWLPQIYRDAGVPAATAGVLLAVIMGMGVPLGLVLPRIAARMRHQGPLVAVLGLCGVAGYTGLLLAPAAGAWLWAVLLGVAMSAFPVALTMIGMRARTAAGVTRLSAFAQSTGYLLSLPGPLLMGVLQESTGGWTVPLLMVLALTVAQIGAGILAGRDRVIEDEG